MFRRPIPTLVLACAVALGLGGTSGAGERESAAALTGDGPSLEVDASGGLYARLELAATASDAGPLARLTLYVPRGFDLYPDRPPGRPVARAFVVAADSAYGATTLSLLAGEVVAGRSDGEGSGGRACGPAPGPRLATWDLQLALLGRQLTIPIVVSGVGPGDPPDAALRLDLCAPTLPGMDGDAGLLLPILAVRLSFTEFDVPSARSDYTWRALVTPLSPDQRTALAEKTYELRARTPFPHALTLDGRYDRGRRQAVLRGRLTAAGSPRAGARVAIQGLIRRVTRNGVTYRDYLAGWATTDVRGAYAFRTRLRTTTGFIAYAPPASRPCSPPAFAPAGCVGTTIAGAESDPITLSVPARPKR